MAIGFRLSVFAAGSVVNCSPSLIAFRIESCCPGLRSTLRRRSSFDTLNDFSGQGVVSVYTAVMATDPPVETFEQVRDPTLAEAQGRIRHERCPDAERTACYLYMSERLRLASRYPASMAGGDGRFSEDDLR